MRNSLFCQLSACVWIYIYIYIYIYIILPLCWRLQNSCIAIPEPWLQHTARWIEHPRGAREAFLLGFSIELALTHFDFEEKTTIDLCISSPVRERKDSWRRALTLWDRSKSSRVSDHNFFLIRRNGTAVTLYFLKLLLESSPAAS